MDPEEVEVKNADRRKWAIGAAIVRATKSRSLSKIQWIAEDSNSFQSFDFKNKLIYSRWKMPIIFFKPLIFYLVTTLLLPGLSDLRSNFYTVLECEK